MKRIENIKEDIENKFTHLLICNLIYRATEDMKNESKYLRKHTQNTAENHKATALYFIKSRLFTELCDAVGWPADSIKTQCLK